MTHRTHYVNLAGLTAILNAGLLCHRINVRQARAYPGTPQNALGDRKTPPPTEHFGTWKADIDEIFDGPMKTRMYPAGRVIGGTHSFFVNDLGTWHRRLGSYSIQIVEPGAARPLYEPSDMVVTGHDPRFIYGAPQEGG